MSTYFKLICRHGNNVIVNLVTSLLDVKIALATILTKSFYFLIASFMHVMNCMALSRNEHTHT